MKGSRNYVDALESLHTMLTCYPMQSGMSSIQVATSPTGRAAITVQLREAQPAVLAAGLIEWKRSLARPESWAWRTPKGNEVHITVRGYGDECDETPIAVCAGPVPYEGYLDIRLEPDSSERLSTEKLYRWFANEVVRAWPFNQDE